MQSVLINKQKASKETCIRAYLVHTTEKKVKRGKAIVRAPRSSLANCWRGAKPDKLYLVRRV